MKLSAHGISDIGINRKKNEDVWLSCTANRFFAIADGMGGHKAGEIAANMTIDSLYKSVQNIHTKDCLEWMIELKAAIEKANTEVFQKSLEDESCRGMGTTLCCMVWNEDAIIYAHVGDSRIYRFRKGKLEQLTQDHSLWARWLKTGIKAKTPYPYKNVITKAIGTTPRANPEISICKYQPKDLFLLCSDGLSDALTTKEIEKVLKMEKNSNLVSEKLIEMAKINGSCDNITLLMIQQKQKFEESLSR